MGSSYTDEFKAEVLARLQLNGGNLQQTSKEMNVPIGTLFNWRNAHLDRHVIKVINDIKQDYRNKLYSVADLLTDSFITDLQETKKRLSLQERMDLADRINDYIARVESASGTAGSINTNKFLEFKRNTGS